MKVRNLISPNRIGELYYLWSTEINEEWTREWRTHLPSAELKFVQQLDETIRIPDANLLCVEVLCFAVEENLSRAV